MRSLLRFVLPASGLLVLAAACGDDSVKPLAPGGGGGWGVSGSRSTAGAPSEDGGEPSAEGGVPGGGEGGTPDAGGAAGAGGAPPAVCNQGRGATILGRVTSPSGELPLGGVSVYVPSETVDPPPSGAGCFRCASALSGVPVALTTTDANGRFELTQAPVGEAVPLVVQTGKWRRQLTVDVLGCEDNEVDDVATRLPQNSSEGDLPAIALVSGGQDTLECLLRKLGVSAEEFAVAPDAGRVRLFQGKGGVPRLSGASPAELPPADSLWSDPEALGIFDLVLLGSEPDSNEAAKPQQALDALRSYLLLGGRVLAQHFQSYFLSAGAADLAAAASYVPARALPAFRVTVDESSARGRALSASLTAADPESVPGSFEVEGGRQLVSAVTAPAVRLLYATTPAAVQAFSLDLPVSPGAACGRVTQTDLLTASGDTIADFPAGCTSEGLSAQERALAYLIFDLGGCLP